MVDPGIGDWSRQRVLVTGHSGFVGSWLSVALLELGAEVVGYAASADAQSAERAVWLAHLGVRDVVGDIRDVENLSAVLSAERFDTVVHLAAQPLVSRGYADPYGTIDTNVRGSLSILEAVRRTRPPVLLHITSDKCYRNQGWPWPYRENDVLGGGCPYSTSKAAAEILFAGYATLFEPAPDGTSAASIRFGNVIGGGDFSVNRLVPDCLAGLAAKRPIELRQPTSLRPFQHVLDVVHGLLRAASALRAGILPHGEVLNFAPPEAGIAVGEMAAALAEAWGAPAPDLVGAIAAEFREESLLLLDGRKASSYLHWNHHLDLRGCAEATVAWHRRFIAGVSAARCTGDDVAAFLKRVGATTALTG
jgi:CDP-glucose 4,6-dehydratase